jgi:hypothetical protein
MPESRQALLSPSHKSDISAIVSSLVGGHWLGTCHPPLLFLGKPLPFSFRDHRSHAASSGDPNLASNPTAMSVDLSIGSIVGTADAGVGSFATLASVLLPTLASVSSTLASVSVCSR